MFLDRFNFEMQVLKSSWKAGLSEDAYQIISDDDEARPRASRAAVWLLGDLSSAPTPENTVNWFVSTLRNHKYGSPALAQKYLADVHNLANFKTLLLNPSMEGGQQIWKAYSDTLSSRQLSVKNAYTALDNALLEEERLLKPYKSGGIFSWRNPGVTYVKWLNANGYKPEASGYQENFALAQKAVKAIQGPEFTQQDGGLVKNYAENILQKIGSEADKDKFLKEYQVAIEAWADGKRTRLSRKTISPF